jgi:DNA-binding NarL/FixJ family response regulator
MSPPIRIALIDDHTLFRESLVRLLERESEFQVVARCATVAEGQRAFVTTAVDVILVDYDLGDEIGTDLLSRLDTGRQKAKVLMVTAGMRAAATHSAIAAGVSGIVLKHSDPRHLIEAIRKVASGETWWDAGIVRTIIAGAKDSQNPAVNVRSITLRQRQVLRSILDGMTTKEIAAQLQASETAIKATIQELFRKAGVRTRSQLVRVAIERYSLDWLSDGRSNHP